MPTGGDLGVDESGGVEPLEVPRVVGNRNTGEASTIRFQASAQGVANKSFGLNHPKNYLAYPLALYHPDDTAEVLSAYVVDAIESAQRGAEFLGLVTAGPSGPALTPLGQAVSRFAHWQGRSVGAALREFEDWKGSPSSIC